MPSTKFNGYIPSIDARVTEMRFFERGSDNIVPDDRVYRSTFDRKTTRFIYHELNLGYPLHGSRADFDVEVTYRRPDGSIFATSTQKSHVEGDWTASSHAFGRGWVDPGKWRADTYTIDLSVKGDLVASGQFVVVDEALPQAGPFLELRDKLAWSKDIIDLPQERALFALSNMLSEDQTLASSVASLPWVSAGVSDRESGALEYLAQLARDDAQLAGRVSDWPWVADEITGDEWQALKYLSLLAAQDTSLSQSVARIPWVEDGITEEEWRTLGSIYGLARTDLLLAERALEIPSVSADLTTEGRRVVQYLKDLTNQDVALAQEVANFPWLKDGISDDERWGLRFLKDITSADPTLGASIAGLPWIGDDLATGERAALRYLRDIHAEDPLLGAQVAAMPFFTDSFEDRDETALYSLAFLQTRYPEELDLLVAQEWYLDSLSDEEASFITTLGRSDQYFTPPDLRDLVKDHQIESRQISLSLSGDITLTFIQAAPDEGNAEIVAQVEEAVKAIEEFIGVPFPTTDVILLFASGEDPVFYSDWLGLHRGTHMVVQPGLARQGDTNRVLIHEVGHYYWGNLQAPLWFREGAPDFLASYVRDKLYDDSLEDRGIYGLSSARDYCGSVNMGTLQKLIDRLSTDGMAKFAEAGYFICNYRLGENFFLQLFDTLGADQFRSALGEIYQLSQDEKRQITEDEIYSAFLRHTTENTENEFKKIYADLHGGAIGE